VALGEGIGHPEILQVGHDRRRERPRGPLPVGTGRQRDKIVADEPNEKRPEADEQRGRLAQPRRGGDGDGRQHEDRLEHEHEREEQLRIEVGERMLVLPVPRDEGDDPEAQREAGAERDRERRGERAAVEVVGQRRDHERPAAAEQAEREHRHVEDVFVAHARLHPVPHAEQEDDRQDPEGEQDRPRDAQILAEHHGGSRHGLADDREHGLVFDLPAEHARGGEAGEEQARQQQRAQAEVHQQLVVVGEGEGRDVDVEHEGADADAQQHCEDPLADRFEKRVASDDEGVHGAYAG